MAADEVLLDSRELRVSRLEETLQRRLRELEDQERANLEANSSSTSGRLRTWTDWCRGWTTRWNGPTVR